MDPGGANEPDAYAPGEIDAMATGGQLATSQGLSNIPSNASALDSMSVSFNSAAGPGGGFPNVADQQQLSAALAAQNQALSAGLQPGGAGAVDIIGQHAVGGGVDPMHPLSMQRKPGSGRPAGVQCKCKCCGALGFYRRSCGRKHRCLIAKCGPAGPGNMGPGGVDPEGGGDIDEAPTMYQVLCANCGAPLQFALPNHPAYIVCYRCDAKMIIQPMPAEADAEAAAGEASTGSLEDKMIPDASPAQPMAPAAKQQQPTQQPVQESFMEETGEVQVQVVGGDITGQKHSRDEEDEATREQRLKSDAAQPAL